MGNYRVDILNNQLQDCTEVSVGSYDETLIKLYNGSFVHIDPETYKIRAYLCKAPSPSEAYIKAHDFLKS